MDDIHYTVYFCAPKTAFRYVNDQRFVPTWCVVRFTKEQLTDAIHVMFIYVKRSWLRWNAQTSIKISEYFDFATENICSAWICYW